MINEVTLLGRLGNAPEVRRLEGGAVVARMSVATSRSYKDKNGEWQEVTQWHNIVVWNKLAESVERLQKGERVFLKGSIEYREYEKDGVSRRVTEIVADMVRRLDKPATNADAAGRDYQQAEKAAHGTPPGVNGEQYRNNGYKAAPPTEPVGLFDDKGGDLPF